MLFATVYGPELPQLHALISALEADGQGAQWKEVYRCAVPNGNQGAIKNVRDAVSFLETVGLVHSDFQGLHAVPAAPFRLAVLRGLRNIEEDEEGPAVDRMFMALVDRVFVLPNHPYCAHLHEACNRVSDIPLSREKINAWARVMEFLGLGRRVAGGFQCIYSRDLIREAVDYAPAGRQEIDVFIDRSLGPYVPCRTQDGAASHSLWAALASLHRAGAVRLERLQDSPARRFGQQGYTHVSIASRS